MRLIWLMAENSGREFPDDFTREYGVSEYSWNALVTITDDNDSALSTAAR